MEIEEGRVPSSERAHDAAIARYYDDAAVAVGLARLYEEKTALGAFYRGRMRRIATELAGLQGRLLDVGCGTGQMLRFLRQTRPEAFELTGIDRAEAMVRVARDVVGDDPQIRLLQARVERLPFASGSYDVVLAMGVLEYVTSVEVAIREIARVLRDGGTAVLTMQNPLGPYRLWERSVYRRIRARRGERSSPIIWCVKARTLCVTLCRAGLVPTAVSYYNFNLLLPPLDARMPRLSVRLERALENVARGPLKRLGSDYFVVARKAEGAGVRKPLSR